MPDLKNLPYDSVYKDFFGRAAMVRSLLQLFCPPDFVNNLDFSSLRACPTGFVTDRFLLLHCDSAWCLRLKDRPDCWVGVIIAFQTRRDPLMPLRLLACSSLVQMALFHGKAGNGKITGENDLLVQILPIIIYRGEEEWNVPMETEACVASGVEYLKEFSPQHRFVLLDEKLMSREILEASDQVAAQFFLLSQTDDPEMILKTVKRLTELPDGNDPDSLNALFTDFLRNIVLVKAGITDTGVMSADLQGVKNMIEANLPQWKRDCFQKGWDEGNAEGKLEALHEAVKRKLKALFGDLPAAVQSAIDQTTDVEILYTVLSPVGESKTLPHYMEQLASGRTAAVNQ